MDFAGKIKKIELLNLVVQHHYTCRHQARNGIIITNQKSKKIAVLKSQNDTFNLFEKKLKMVQKDIIKRQMILVSMGFSNTTGRYKAPIVELKMPTAVTVSSTRQPSHRDPPMP